MLVDTSSSALKFVKDEHEPTQAPWTVLRAARLGIQALSQSGGWCLLTVIFLLEVRERALLPLACPNGTKSGAMRRALADRGALAAVERSRRSHV